MLCFWFDIQHHKELCEYFWEKVIIWKWMNILGQSKDEFNYGSTTAMTWQCDMIKGNESLVENCNSYFLTPLTHNFKMLNFDANHITNIWLQSYEEFVNAKNNINQQNLNNISKTISPTSDSFLLIMSHICYSTNLNYWWRWVHSPWLWGKISW